MQSNILSLESLKILLIGVQKDEITLIEKSLLEATLATHHVQKAEDMTSALRVISKNPFDLVMLDIALADMSDFAVLSSLQNIAPKLPVIILTTQAEESLALKAVEYGAQDYLFKNEINAHTLRRAFQYAIQRKQFEGILILQANFDPLTRLANQILFESRLDMAIARSKRNGNSIGVLLLNLNNFQLVNDTLGYQAGDRLLQQVAERVKLSIRPYDTAARLVGDEFAIIVESIKQAQDCVVVANRVIQKMRQPFVHANKDLHIATNIGIVISTAAENLTREDLICQAREAMFTAKITPGSDYIFYTPRVVENTAAGI